MGATSISIGILIALFVVVKMNRGGARAAEYVQRVDPSPIHLTTNRKLALVMGKFVSEDAIQSLQNSRCTPELVSIQVDA